jgi:nicotinate-nucleotide adenylyltransferase
MPQRVGILGGTFDPVHIGHLRAAEETAEALGLETLLFIPAVDPPHKTGKRVQPYRHRRRMLELSLEGHPFFRISDVEQQMPGKSYSVLTLRKLRREVLPDAQLYFLVGLDAFLELNTWWHYRELFELAHLAVLRRPGYDERRMADFLTQNVSSLYVQDVCHARFDHPELCSVHYLHNTHMEISSTCIRSLFQEGRSIRYLVLPGVMGYIQVNQLYCSERTIIS